MLNALDHIIIGVHDLAQAEAIFSQKLGLAVSGGGIHPSGGTANRIIVIGDTYLELITVRAPQEAQQSILDRLSNGEGYLNFVLSSNDIEADSAAMAQRGVFIMGPDAGQLRSPDGKVRGWSRTNVERSDLTQHYPFIIQHDSSGEERRFRLAGWAEPPIHPLGATKVLSTTLAVANLAEATPRFQHIYGLQPTSTFTGEADTWEAMLVAFPLGTSGQSVELAEPLPLVSTATENSLDPTLLPDSGALPKHLQTYGESLCRITLAVENLTVARHFLDEQQVTYTYDTLHSHPVLWIRADQACGATIVLHEVIA